MSVPCELSLSEIRNFMLIKGGKVTNHELVKYFKKFLTNPNTQAEARKQFKTYVNILSTIKNEGKDKYLILRKKYINECPAEDNLSLLSLSQSDFANSPGSRSTISEHDSSVVGTSLSSQFGAPDSPFREPPPYKPPPEVKIPGLASETKEQYKDCVDEFKYALSSFGIGQSEDDKQSVEVVKDVIENSPPPPVLPPRKRSNAEKINEQVSDEKAEENKENASIETSSKSSSRSNTLEKQISVAEATKKFNRIASEEEAKVTSPPTKKKPEKRTEEISNEILISSHPKSKEWLVSSAKANYQELAKLASEYPELTKLHDLTTGDTALHWAAKHGNEDVVKLIAGTHRADVNSRTNGGYTPLHLAMQFGKDNIFELLCNVYKADRDILDWSGRKPLDYRKIHTTVSASTYSKKDLGFLRIGSLNVRVKRTTEAFSNFLGVGSNQTRIPPPYLRTSAPSSMSYFEKVHKNWGSADNIIPHGRNSKKMDSASMPPPKIGPVKKRRSKRAFDVNTGGYRSVPTTPNQQRAKSGVPTLMENPNNQSESESDSACGFDSNWKDG
ncbi:ankyrin repeat domain-containing protein SOWAHC isoform X3 [Bradysia coprophila]|uniref:ankyrin repeat domain-containing protein SOWAHC isoform X3 n=1 Tax=Bradysia coprophila TaxID=38358 RepID=UPI00187D7169|nr:ankyrin repeat domain-containing protein SOWAHC isoform X3 [Bradysia coprophila]